MLKKLRPHTYLILIILLALILRNVNLFDSFFFGFDSARDFHEAWRMVYEQDVRLIGPVTDIPGLNHGVLYYYILAFFYFVTGFNPNGAIFLIGLVHVLGIILMYYFGTSIKNKKLGLIAAFLWAISFEQANYARFLSNPTFTPITTGLMFFGLYQFFIKKKSYGLPLSVVGYALSIHTNFYLVYLGVFYILFALIFKAKIKFKKLIMPGLLFTMLTSTFIISEIKFKLLGIQSLLGYIGQSNNITPRSDIFEKYATGISKILHFSFFSFNNVAAVVLFSCILVYLLRIGKASRKNIIFLLVWFFSTLPLFVFNNVNVVSGEFIHSSLAGATALLTAMFVYSLLKNKKMFAHSILIIITISNLSLFVQHEFNNTSFLAHQPMMYGDLKEVVDYTYDSSDGEEFSICSANNPLFINTVWSAAYSIHGKNYQYIPTWSGAYQEEFPTFLTGGNKNLMYLIIEPTNQIFREQHMAIIYYADQISIIEEERTIGKITVQKRRLTGGPSGDSQKLSSGDLTTVNKLLSDDHRYRCDLAGK